MKQNCPFNTLYKIATSHSKNKIGKILSVGCRSDGSEAIEIAKKFPDKSIVGIDKALDQQVKTALPKNCALIKADFLKNNLGGDHFDLVYCYHVIEHIASPINALKKMADCLGKDGAAIVGFPNKNRIVGDINPTGDVSNIAKIRSNFFDYKKRITGKFNNKYAHAGFTKSEFEKMAKRYFASVRPIAKEYYILKYPRFGWIVRVMDKTKISKYIFPSNYFLLIK